MDLICNTFALALQSTKMIHYFLYDSENQTVIKNVKAFKNYESLMHYGVLLLKLLILFPFWKLYLIMEPPCGELIVFQAFKSQVKCYLNLLTPTHHNGNIYSSAIKKIWTCLGLQHPELSRHMSSGELCVISL